MSEETARLVDRLRDRLHRTIRRITWAHAAFGTAVVLGTLAAVWFIVVAVEAGLWLGTTPRTALAVCIALITLGVIGAYLARPLGQLIGWVDPPSEEAVARSIGERYPEVSDRLLNLLQLARGERSHAPEPMIDRAVERLGSDIEGVRFEEVETFDRARTAARLASLPVVAVLAFLLMAPSTFLDASQRLLTPTTPYQRPAPFQLSVSPGNTTVVKGDSLEISIRATGETPPAVTLLLRSGADTGTETVTVPADAPGVYTHALSGVRQSLEYRVEARPVQTGWYRADVLARPLVRSLQVTLAPPAYTGLPEQTLDANVGDVTGLPGTDVTVSTRLGGPEVDSAAVVFEDGARVPMEVTGERATASFPLTEAGRYRVRLHSRRGVSNRDPIRYQLALRADARPTVSFLAPEGSSTIAEDLATELRLRLSDDFGFSDMKLYYRLSEQRFGTGQSAFSSLDLPLQRPRSVDQEVVHQWLLAQDSGLDLVPGDVVEYYVQVWDNDVVTGPKSATTRRQTLRLPSLAEQYESLDERQSTVEKEMEDLKEDSEAVDRQFDALQEELRRKQQADWEDQRQLDQLKQKQQQVEQGVEELSRKMQELTRQMQQENLTSPETAQKYEELQRVIEEINSPDLQKALENLQKSMQKMDLRQMQKAMEDFEFSEEQYRQRLERSLDLFKQIKAQQKLEEMSNRLGTLSQLEKRLAEETRKREKASPEKPSSENQRTGEEAEKNDASREDAGDADAPREETDPSEGESSEGESSERESSEGEPSDAEASERETGESEEAGDPNAAEGEASEQPDASGSESSEPRESESRESESMAPADAAHPDLADEQQRAAEEMRQIMEEMQQLSDEMKDVRSAPREQMQRMNRQMQQQNLPQQMQQNSEQLRQNQLRKAREGQQQMQQQLQQMQQRMQQMNQSMQGQQMQINRAGLRSALENTLRLSQKQEDLRGTVNELSGDSPALRPLAQEQKQLVTGLETVSDSLQSLARNIPQMSRTVQKETGNALREMKDATESLSEREAGPASGHQKGSMMHLNELALLLSDLMDQMQSGSGSGSGMSMQQMMQQLQQMTGDQQKVNQQIQQFLNDVQGNRLSVDQKERLKQLSRQQRQIQKELKELSQQPGANEQVLGDLNRIAEQMEETIRELQQGTQNRETLQRQRQILTRMLQAQKSLQTQGKKDERQGSTSEEEFDRAAPEDVSPREEAETLRRDLIRALETGYAPDYETLIRRYFELLEQSGGANSSGDGS